MTIPSHNLTLDLDRLKRSLHFDNPICRQPKPGPMIFILGIALLTLLVGQSACAPKAVKTSTGQHEPNQQNPDWLQQMVDQQQTTKTNPPLREHEKRSGYVPQQANALSLPTDRIMSNEQDSRDPSQPIRPILNTATPPERTNHTDHGRHHGHGGQHNQQHVNIVIENNKAEKEDKALPQLPFSRLEQLYNSYGLSKGKSLRQFGYTFFEEQHQITKANTTDDKTRETEDSSAKPFAVSGPVSPDYILGPGDEILIDITGSVKLNERVIIDREAKLNIPQVGQLSLLATPYKDLRPKIQKLVDQKYRNAKVDVSLGRLHEIRIMMVGKVQRPGILLIPANATVMDALIAAKGPTKEGSLRGIQLQRRGQKVITIDLYQWLKSESRPEDIPLIEGDIIRVPDLGPTAAILGPTTEGIYEYIAEENLNHLMNYAGFQDRFTHEKAVLETVNIQKQREIIRLTLNTKALKRSLKDGDVIRLETADARINDTVTLEGPVLRPASYPWKQGMKVSDLLHEGEGFLINASLKRALLIRKLGKTSKLDISPGDQRAETRQEMIWIDLAAVLSGDPQADHQLQRLDRIKIMTRDQVQDRAEVTIMGAVRKPGTYELSSGMTLQDLIQLAGGPTREAYMGLNNILRSSMTNDQQQLDVSLVPFNLKKNLSGKQTRIMLKNQDQIVIRRMQSLQVKVTVEGRVQFPGTYVLPDGYTIADALSAAGGLMKDADLRAAIFTRQRIRQLQNQRLDHLDREQKERFARVRDFVTRDGHTSEAVANDLSLMGLNRLKQNMAKYQTLGRIVIDMTSTDFPKRRDNLVLESGDQLIIPRRSQTVLVMGRVFNPNAFVWQDDWTVADYLERAGGLKEDADKDNIYVMLANGEVRALGDGEHQIALADYTPRAGDTILAPQEALGRSELHMLNDGLLILRQLVEIGAIGASIPKLTSPSIDLSSSTNHNQNAYDGAAYQGLLQRQILRP